MAHFLFVCILWSLVIKIVLQQAWEFIRRQSPPILTLKSVVVYYIPIWFQAIKGVSAVESGIRNIPMILGLVLISIVIGIIVTVLGYYTPWMIVSSLLMAVGAGLLATFKVETGHAKWIGYQALYGFGVGAGMQQGVIAAQTVCTLDDIPTATGIFQSLKHFSYSEWAILILEPRFSCHEFCP